MSKFSALSKARLAEQCLSELLRRGKAGLSPIDVNIRALTHASFLDGAGKFGNIAFPTDTGRAHECSFFNHRRYACG